MAAKKTKAKSQTTRKAKAKPRAQAKKQTRATSKTKIATKRPDQNLTPSAGTINTITNELLDIVGYIDEYAANLRALDRKRHNGVGMKRQGFIEAAFRLSTKFPQYFPHWLNTVKFKDDLDLFNAIRSLVEVCRSLEEKAWNINVESSDMVYTDALEYYSQVQDAAERRIDSAESIYNELHGFFRHGSRNEEEPTEKQVKRDVNALMHGRKEGGIVIKNFKPKTTGGKREIIDETFKDSASFKKTDEGDITE